MDDVLSRAGVRDGKRLDRISTAVHEHRERIAAREAIAARRAAGEDMTAEEVLDVARRIHERRIG
jgi:hypothetical protein